MGCGKTLLLANSSFRWKRLNPTGLIMSNVTIDIRDFIYLPNLFLRWEELQGLEVPVFLGIDDVKNLDVLKRFIPFIASLSRKIDLSLCITGQRRVYVTPDVREILTACGPVNFKPVLNSDDEVVDGTLAMILKYDDNEYNDRIYVIKNAIKNVAGKYNTKEVVPYVTDSDIVDKILDECSNRKDCEINFTIAFGKTEARRLMKVNFGRK